MDERIARLKTSRDARQLAENADRLGRPDISSQALERARELQAIEQGFTSPAQTAIAAALYAYEEEQSKLTNRTFRANRTRQMLARHGAIRAAERMVLNRQPSKGFEVLEDAGLRELSFEAIIERFPDEFSALAVEAARARLRGDPLPSISRAMSPQTVSRSATIDAQGPPAVFDGEARMFLNGFREPDNRFMAQWLPSYREAIQTIKDALSNNRLDYLFGRFWKCADNDIANAGPGQLKYETVDELREDLTQVIRDIYEDEGPENFGRIVERFERWKAEGRINMVPRLMIARAFAGIHPRSYHTTVDASSQDDAIQWFMEHTGFAKPSSGSWSEKAQALATHLDKTQVFGDDILERNVFPWFIVEQLRARSAPTKIKLGHTPRVFSALVNIQPAQRTIILRHNMVQTALHAQLATQFGVERVWTECETGTGGYADAIAREPDGRCHLYEIKIADTAAEVVRQAIGQLLEYGFRAGGLEPVKLYAVGEPALDDVTRRFIARLRSDFRLDLDYLQIELPAS